LLRMRHPIGRRRGPGGRCNTLISLRKSGAGEGIRTLDPNLGKIALELFGSIPEYPTALLNH
jgi:hypothetical protein